MVEHLTKSELDIMEVMWDQEDALTATEIIKAVSYTHLDVYKRQL